MKLLLSRVLLLALIVALTVPAGATAQTATPTATALPTDTPTPTATVAATATATVPAPVPFVAYVPVVMKQLAGSNTGIQVQNTANSPATVQVFYYNRMGQSSPTWTNTATVAAGASETFYQGADPGLPIPFDGSAVVQATQSIRAIVNQTNYDRPTASAGSFPAPSSSNVMQASLPAVFGGLGRDFTTIHIQNTGSMQATVTVSLFPSGSGAAVASIPVVIQPLAAERVRLASGLGLPSNFAGTALVTSSNGTLVAAAETLNEATGIMTSYAAFPQGASVQNAPLLFKNFLGWVSSAHAMNVSGGTVTVNATLYHRDSALSYPLPPRTLAPNEGYTWSLPALADLPDGVWSGVFSANGAIALVVQEINASRGTGMAYSGFSGGTPDISIPLTFRDSNGWDTGIQVQNLGAIESIVTVEHYRTDTGSRVAVEAEAIPPGQSRTFYQPENANLAPGHVGSAVITSNNGQPIVAIVNEVNYLRGGDAAMAYEGVNY